MSETNLAVEDAASNKTNIVLVPVKLMQYNMVVQSTGSETAGN